MSAFTTRQGAAAKLEPKQVPDRFFLTILSWFVALEQNDIRVSLNWKLEKIEKTLEDILLW